MEIRSSQRQCTTRTWASSRFVSAMSSQSPAQMSRRWPMCERLELKHNHPWTRCCLQHFTKGSSYFDLRTQLLQRGSGMTCLPFSLAYPEHTKTSRLGRLETTGANRFRRQGWYDADGVAFDCAWYASEPGRCEVFGATRQQGGDSP